MASHHGQAVHQNLCCCWAAGLQSTSITATSALAATSSTPLAQGGHSGGHYAAIIVPVIAGVAAIAGEACIHQAEAQHDAVSTVEATAAMSMTLEQGAM